MTEEDAAQPPEKPRSRRWFLGVGGGLLGAAAIYGLSRGGFRLWMNKSLPANAPRIAFSLDDTWLNDLGITDTTYQQAMTRAGGRLERFAPDLNMQEGSIPEDLLSMHGIDGLLLTGGGDVDPALYGGDEDAAILVNRERDDFEIALIHQALTRDIPVLGICRGCQILNVAFGGTLRSLRNIETLNDAHFTFRGHAVTIAQGSLLSRILDTSDLENFLSFHGQAVDQPGDQVRVVARGPEDIVEAIEAGDPKRDWAIAVQWHPEMAPANPLHGKLFRAFVERASRIAATRWN